MRFVVEQPVLLPFFACYDENRVGYSLSRQACSCGAEGQRQFKTRCLAQDQSDFVFVGYAYDYPGYKPVETGIGTPCKASQGIGVYAFFVDDAADAAYEIPVFSTFTFHDSLIVKMILRCCRTESCGVLVPVIGHVIDTVAAGE